MIKVNKDFYVKGCTRYTDVDVNGKRYLLTSDESSPYEYELCVYEFSSNQNVPPKLLAVEHYDYVEDVCLAHDSVLELFEDLIAENKLNIF